jgi:DNA modification methylase
MILYNDECENILKEMEGNSVDTVITDPPYGLKFMGRKWDYDVPSVSLWKEVLRVMKHGATMLCFAGSRTQHRMAVNIEDAGFILKDTIMWFYGEGFPKATNISKQIDKNRNKILLSIVKLKKELIKFFDKSEKSRKQIDIECGFRACNYLSLPDKTKKYDPWINILPTQEKWEKIKEVIGCDDSMDEAFKNIEREIIGKQIKARTKNQKIALPTLGDEVEYVEIPITKPETEEANLWNGWKSHGIKPAYEPIIVAIKPNDGSYAENALKHGVSGLNIDAARIKTKESGNRKHKGKIYENVADGYKRPNKSCFTHKTDWEMNKEGRYPANIIFSHHPECVLKGVKKVKSHNPDNKVLESRINNIYGRDPNRMLTDYAKNGKETVDDYDCHEDCPVKMLDDQGKKSGSHSAGSKQEKQDKWSYDLDNSDCYGSGTLNGGGERYGDEGGASRFFYCAKASKNERNIGCDLIKNDHPTVKPIKIMEYLCKLTSTPTGGIVFDPFMGSGSTGIACINTGRDFIGIEKEPEYFEIAKSRIEYIENEEIEKVEDEKRKKESLSFFFGKGYGKSNDLYSSK